MTDSIERANDDGVDNVMMFYLRNSFTGSRTSGFDHVFGNQFESGEQAARCQEVG